MAKKAAQKTARSTATTPRGSKAAKTARSTKRASADARGRGSIRNQKLRDLRPLLEDDELCERLYPEPIGPGEWRVTNKKP